MLFELSRVCFWGGGEVALACYQGVDRRSAGFRLLERMGWREGRGLGAQEQGITSHIRVKRPREGEGVGQREADARAQDWTRQAAAFDRVLSGLRAHSSRDDLQAADAGGGGDDAPEKGRKRAKKEAAREARKAEKEARKAEKEARKAEKEARKAEKRAGKEARQAVKRGEAPAAGGGCAAASPARGGTHLGRYKKREAGKNVRNYSAGDLAQILGIQASELPPASAGPAPAAQGAETPPRRVVVEVELPPDARRTYTVPPVPEKWWGRRIFTRQGVVGDAAEALPSKQEDGEKEPGAGEGETGARVGFREEDQERLFRRAQEASQKGKKGLGRGALPAANLGNDWKGSRKTFGEDEDAGGGGGREGARKAKTKKEGRKEKKGKKEKKKSKA